MIRNEKQYAVTRSWIRDFEHSVSVLDEKLRCNSDPIVELERDGLRGQLGDLKGEMKEYELLRSGNAGAVQCDLEDLPGTLVRRRISLGLSERDVAERVGLSERDVQEYERTGYGGASYDTLMGILSALPDGSGGDEVTRWTAADFEGALDRLSRVGLDGKFLARHVLYEPAAALGGGMREHSKPKLLARLEALFGWTSRQVLGGEQLSFEPAAHPRGCAADQGHLHVAYAMGMARILGKAAPRRAASGGPASPGILLESMAGSIAECQAELPRDGGRGAPRGSAAGRACLPSFALLVKCAWDSGIPVLRLGSLAFRSACFRGDGPAVVVLSGNRTDETGLMLDLLRGVYRAGAGGECVHTGRAPGRVRYTAADEFAYAVLLGGDADRMFRECLSLCAERGGGPDCPPVLGESVARVARRSGVRPDSLARYVMHRLVGWLSPGACPAPIRGMQEHVRGWPAVVSDAVLERADLSALDGPALALLSGAVRAGYARGRPAAHAARDAPPAGPRRGMRRVRGTPEPLDAAPARAAYAP